MVALAVPHLGATIPLSLHRPMLDLAHEAFDSGDYVRCGCQLRESINRFLTAYCQLYEVKFSKCKSLDKRPPAVKLKKLIEGGYIGDCCGNWLGEVIDTCNRLAHCQPVKRREVSCALEIAYSLIVDSDDGCLSRGGEGGQLWPPCAIT